MDRSLTASLFCVVSLALASGCAPVDSANDPNSSTSTSAVTLRACPEAVTLDGRGDPRNAAGQIRNCWPGEAKCFCDSDNDCYSLDGYVACTPVTATASTATRTATTTTTTTSRDAGVADSGARDSGTVARDSGTVAVADGGARDAGTVAVLDSGVRDAGTVATQPVDSGVAATPPPPSGAVATSASTPSSGLRAFPGAEGFGASATGGRGGRVIYVTNLNTSGPGSFQDAVQQTGPRYILFKVSGVINGDVQIGSGDLTIAGQSSPAGITVRGLHTTEAVYCDQQCGPNARGIQNFIVRHLRTRPASGDFPDALRLRYSRNGVIDHLSMGNASDESVEISYTNNVTIQDSILAETIGDHAQYGGMLINYTNPAAGYQLDNLTIVRNTWNRILGRMPEFSRESAGAAAGTTLHVELDQQPHLGSALLHRRQPHGHLRRHRRLGRPLPDELGRQLVLLVGDRPLRRDLHAPRGRRHHGLLRGQPLQPLADPSGLGPQLLLQRLQRQQRRPARLGAHRAARLPGGDRDALDQRPRLRPRQRGRLPS